MKTITIRLTTGDLEALKEEAERLRLSISGLIRMKLAQANS